MGKEKKKGERGEATTYYTRTQAMRKLQISMPEFRRLCILKGVYPQEPRHKKKVNKGSSVYKTYYFRKDIQWLAHEPLLTKGRDFKVFVKKLKKALGKDDQVKMASVEEHRPRYTLDHIVQERYPSFVDALRDIDDALTIVFLYSSMASKKVKSVVIHNCRRIAVEFMHYVIESRALRKVFLSIKGVYYQVEIEGQSITWLTPYSFPQRMPKDVDFHVMSTFVEFYSTLLGFINFRLYNMINLRYPPQISGLGVSPDSNLTPTLLVDPRDLEWDHSEHREMLESLSHSLKRVVVPQEDDLEAMDDIPIDLSPEEQALRDKAKIEQEELEKFKNLFSDCRFFISRETPRESLTFVIRSFGGTVSWDSTEAVGGSYSESDESITHQIVDRPDQKHRFLSRVYVQPQWVYDSVNFKRLMPVDNYTPGSVLPPHLSPFVEEKEGDYVTPEKSAILEAFGNEGEEASSSKEYIETDKVRNPTDYMDEILSMVKDQDSEEMEEGDSGHECSEASSDEGGSKPIEKKRRIEQSSRVGQVIAGDSAEEVDEDELKVKQDKEDKRLAIMMMAGKRRKLYERIMKGKNKKKRKIKQLYEKRQKYEANRRTKNN